MINAQPSTAKVFKFSLKVLSALIAGTVFSQLQAQPATGKAITPVSSAACQILDAKIINATSVEISFSNGPSLVVDFYADHVFRLFQDNSGAGVRPPEAKPQAHILVANPRQEISDLKLSRSGKALTLSTGKIEIVFDLVTSLFKVVNLQNKTTVLQAVELPEIGIKQTQLGFKENLDEYFYGGGVQNGRFSHKGKIIAIENQNSWTDGGVASPTPFYWSSQGYGCMWHTFKKGRYDFGAALKGRVQLTHETNYLDLFLMVNATPAGILNDFYQLTGNPVLLPKFGFYEGHLNAYNRDFWKEDPKGILFEDGKRYKESQKDTGGIKESLNGEKGNYQFSARAVIDRYHEADMPLGWILPNDGYGAGYGQSGTLDGNIQNLNQFGEYAREKGVEIGLWTQSDLHPVTNVSALLQRDIVKEVRDAGVRVLKTDVAWVGPGYSFGLHGVADVAEIMPQYGGNARPFIISIDGWAGTQRHAAIWSGDQTGGNWEYIRFHIPTYIGSGLSGQPNITSDVDGIFGGNNPIVNMRDFQWKSFTPMQLNMDGWGANPKYPHALSEPATSVNRNYLKLKAELMPYAYSIAKAAVAGLPMMRAMFLEEHNSYTAGSATQYQFMYGPFFLVAPIYQATASDATGNDIRNGIYLPAGSWIDYFTGEGYQGGRIINHFESPIWKLPVFVKAGAIIPRTNPNNNVAQINQSLRIYEIYPSGRSSFIDYDDDGVTQAYKQGQGVTTLIESRVDWRRSAHIMIHPAQGDFEGFIKDKVTEFRINVTQPPSSVVAKVGGKKIRLLKVASRNELERRESSYFYDAAPDFNQFSTPGCEIENLTITKNPQIVIRLPKTDTTKHPLLLEVKGFCFQPIDTQRVTKGHLTAPEKACVSEINAGAQTLRPSWDAVANADFYEVEFNQMLYSTIKDCSHVFDGLIPETEYCFKVRAVNKSGHSPWAGFTALTKPNPLEFAIPAIKALVNVPDQGGSGIANLFDFDEKSMWHTKWGAEATPFEISLDLQTVNQLDKLEYLPRVDGGNGTLLEGQIFTSQDKQAWSEAGAFKWESTGDMKTFNFDAHRSARYLRIAVVQAVGKFGSGRELYIYKLPGTESLLPGDINHDGVIDRNDLTSYINYTGLREGDADFEGYVSKGDLNRNGLIDAYDISVVATQLDGGVGAGSKGNKLAGRLELRVPPKTYEQGEAIQVTVRGIDLKAVNALSFALPYNTSQYEFVELKGINLGQMANLTNDRLHSNRERVLYPTLVNIGKQRALSGSSDLFILKFKAKQRTTFDSRAEKGMLVDRDLNSLEF
ncbi:MAG: glycoside hydrolase family 31 protein [Kiritimatiellae bacterium]|nr:glycoside hydrolase family 31 protein [Kiritimatiellia bacterium]